jgi:hypothetical protein
MDLFGCLLNISRQHQNNTTISRIIPRIPDIINTLIWLESQQNLSEVLFDMLCIT